MFAQWMMMLWSEVYVCQSYIPTTYFLYQVLGCLGHRFRYPCACSVARQGQGREIRGKRKRGVRVILMCWRVSYSAMDIEKENSKDSWPETEQSCSRIFVRWRLVTTFEFPQMNRAGSIDTHTHTHTHTHTCIYSHIYTYKCIMYMYTHSRAPHNCWNAS